MAYSRVYVTGMVGGMGQYVKVYLTTEELELANHLKTRRAEAKEDGAAINAILKEGLRAVLLGEGLLKEKPPRRVYEYTGPTLSEIHASQAKAERPPRRRRGTAR